MNYEKYTLCFYLKARENPFIYEVDESERNRFSALKNIELNKEEHKHNIFFSFDTKNGMSVAVSLKYLQYAYSLFDPDYEKLFPQYYKDIKEKEIQNISTDKQPEDNSNSTDDSVKLIFIYKSEVVKIEIDEPEYAFMLMNSIDNYPDFDEKLVSIFDIDGEEVLINPEELLLIELPKELYDEGFKQINPDANEEKG